MHSATKIIHPSKETQPTPSSILPSNVTKNISKTNPKANAKAKKSETKQTKHFIAYSKNSTTF